MNLPQTSSLMAAILLTWLPLCAVNEDLTALERRRPEARGRAKVELLIQICQQQCLVEPLRAPAVAAEAVRLAHQIGELRLQVDALNTEARALHTLGRHKEALQCLSESEKLAAKESYQSGLATSYLEQAKVHQLQGNPARSLELEYKALGLEETLGNPGRIADCLNIIGGDHYRQREFDLAGRSWGRALDLHRKTGNRIGQANLLSNLGALAIARKDLDAAERVLTQAIEIREELKEQSMLHQLYNNLGMVWQERGDFPKAESYYFKSLTLKEKLGDQRGLAVGCVNLAELYLAWNRPTASRTYLTKGRALVESIGAKDVMVEAYALEANLAGYNADYASAWSWQKRVQTLKDEMYSKDVASRLAEANARYESTQKEHQIELLKMDQALRQNRVRYYLTACGFLALLSLLLLNRYRSKSRSERELQIKNEALERMNLQKTEFLGIVAHDLRNPIAGMVLVAETLIGAQDLEQIWADAGALREQGAAINQLLNRYLCVTAIESGKLKAAPEVLPLREIVNEAIFRGSIAARAKEILLAPLTMQDPCWSYADPGFVGQIMDNLISNAIKFSPRGTQVTVTLAPVGEEQLVSIADQGPGIPTEDRQRLFDRFTRLSARPTANESSTGLGLSIVKQMVEASGGRVWVEDAPEGGAMFRITLPSAKPDWNH